MVSVHKQFWMCFQIPITLHRVFATWKSAHLTTHCILWPMCTYKGQRFVKVTGLALNCESFWRKWVTWVGMNWLDQWICGRQCCAQIRTSWNTYAGYGPWILWDISDGKSLKVSWVESMINSRTGWTICISSFFSKSKAFSICFLNVQPNIKIRWREKNIEIVLSTHFFSINTFCQITLLPVLTFKTKWWKE